MPDAMPEPMLREVFAEWEKGEFGTTTHLFAEDLRFTAAQPEGQVEARGVEGLSRFMRGFLPQWERYWVVLHDLEDLGQGRFLAHATQHGRGSAGRVDITADTWIAIRVRDGSIAQLEWWFQRDAAAAALG